MRESQRRVVVPGAECAPPRGPRPPADILAAGATKSGPADSLHWAMGLTGATVTPPDMMPAFPSYYAAADMTDPMAWPANP